MWSYLLKKNLAGKITTFTYADLPLSLESWNQKQEDIKWIISNSQLWTPSRSIKNWNSQNVLLVLLRVDLYGLDICSFTRFVRGLTHIQDFQQEDGLCWTESEWTTAPISSTSASETVWLIYVFLMLFWTTTALWGTERWDISGFTDTDDTIKQLPVLPCFCFIIMKTQHHQPGFFNMP